MLKTGLFRMNGVLVILLSLISVFVRAQSPGNLILMDADTRQPFTVRIGDQLFASSGHGHLIITHLQDGNYKLSVRFVKQKTGEQIFPVTINEKDLGLQITKSDSSWVLYNWQSKETIGSVREIDSSRVLEQGIKREDGFSSLMAAVVNDTAVMYNTYTGQLLSGHDSLKLAKSDSSAKHKIALNKKSGTDLASQKKQTTTELPKQAISEPPKQSVAELPKQSVAELPKPVPAELPKQSVADLPKPAPAELPKQSIAETPKPVPTELPKKSVAETPKPVPAELPKQSVAEIPKPAGPIAIIQDKKPLSDSIQPEKPLVKVKTYTPAIKKVREVSLKISRKIVYTDMSKDGSVDTVVLFVYFESLKDTPKTVKITQPPTANPPALSSGGQSGQPPTANSQPPTANPPAVSSGGQSGQPPTVIHKLPSCSQIATDVDLASVRSAVLEANTEQEKIAVASGAFALKCFTVAQVRVLAGLFVSEKTRYKLMDAARLHVSDREQFRAMLDMFADKNLQKKFLLLADKQS